MLSLSHPHTSLCRGLVAWYGLFQLAHALHLGRYLLNPGSPPFEAPPEGWLSQTVAFVNGMAVAFVNGMAVADFLNALLTLVFVFGYFRGRAWSAWLGTLTLTVSIYAAVVFLWGAVESGALRGVGSEYLWLNVPFVPVVVLFGAWCYWGATGHLAELGASNEERRLTSR